MGHGQGRLEGCHLDEAPTLVVAGQGGVEFGGPGPAGQGAQVQRDLDDHALAEAPDAGHQQRTRGEPAAPLDLRHVLVGEAERVGPERRCDGVRAVRILEPLDHLAAAAAIARDRVDRNRRLGRHQTGGDQGVEQRHRGQRVAARVGDPLGAGDARRLLGVEFRQAIDPVRIDPVRGAGVDQARSRVLDHGHGLARRVIGQAEHREIGGVEHLGAGVRVLARALRQAQKLDIGAALEPPADLQAGGAGLAVDEDLRHIGRHIGRRIGRRIGAGLEARGHDSAPLPSRETLIRLAPPRRRAAWSRTYRPRRSRTSTGCRCRPAPSWWCCRSGSPRRRSPGSRSAARIRA